MKKKLLWSIPLAIGVGAACGLWAFEVYSSSGPYLIGDNKVIDWETILGVVGAVYVLSRTMRHDKEMSDRIERRLWARKINSFVDHLIQARARLEHNHNNWVAGKFDSAGLQSSTEFLIRTLETADMQTQEYMGATYYLAMDIHHQKMVVDVIGTIQTVPEDKREAIGKNLAVIEQKSFEATKNILEMVLASGHARLGQFFGL